MTRRKKNSSNDDSGPYPSRRSQPDVRKWKTRGKVLRIAAWNVRTVFKAGNYDNLLMKMKNMNLDILGTDGKVVDEEYVTIYSGGDKHENGVGLMMTEEVEKSMIGYWPISDRVMIWS